MMVVHILGISWAHNASTNHRSFLSSVLASSPWFYGRTIVALFTKQQITVVISGYMITVATCHHSLNIEIECHNQSLQVCLYIKLSSILGVTDNPLDFRMVNFVTVSSNQQYFMTSILENITNS